MIISAEESTGLPVVKILDMGLAKFASTAQTAARNWDGLEHVSTAEGSLTMTGQVIGSPNYIAPEQAEDAMGADTRADIYSLGTVLFEMLTGHLPFNGTNILEILQAKLLHEAPRASDLRPDLPQDLDDIVTRMLASNPEERFQTPHEVAEAIDPFTDYSPEVDAATGVAPETRRMSDASIAIPAISTIGTTVEAKADDTVNEFIDLLEDRAIVKTEPTSVSKTMKSRRKQKDSMAWVFYGVIGGLFMAFISGVYIFWDDEEGKNADGKNGQNKQDAPREYSAPPTDHRLAADWVLGNDGQVTIEIGGRQRIIRDKADLPGKDFFLVKLSMDGANGVQIARLGLVKSLSSLESVSLSDCEVTDNDLETFAELGGLSVLDLSLTQITGTGLEDLAKVRNLSQLNISRTIVSDNGIENLAELKRLTSLDLEQTDVSDAAVEHIKKLKRLQFLNVRNTKITADGAKQLKAALPRCDIISQ